MMAMFGWALCVSGASVSPAGLRGSEFIFVEAPFAECHASTLAQTPAGLVAAWFGGTEEGDRDVGIWISRRQDGGWSIPREVANGVQYRRPDGTLHRHPCWNPVLYASRSGPLLLFYKCGPSPSTWWGMLMVSDDHGTTWSIPRRLPEHIDGPVKNKPVVIDDNLLCGSSTEHDGWRVHFERTSDLGRTWTRIGPINDGHDIGAIQPSILTHPDGRLQILCRNRDGRGGELWQSWSMDRGWTWSPLEGTGLPNPNAGTDAVTLADGRQLLVYNHTHRGGASPRGREMLNVAVSPDGTRWFASLVLENTPNREFSYPAVIQTDDGRVHITYTWQRQRIRYVVLDPQDLRMVPIQNGEWPDL